jgi:hypothetical protein
MALNRSIRFTLNFSRVYEEDFTTEGAEFTEKNLCMPQ